MAQQKYRRHLRNYLLDKRFQLTYAVTMVGISLILTGLLGYLVYRQMRQSMELYERQAEENLRSFKEQAEEIISTLEEQGRETQNVFREQAQQTREVFAKKTEEETGLLEMLKQVPEFREQAEQMLSQLKEDDKKTIEEFNQKLKEKEKLLVARLQEAKKKKERQLAKTEQKMKEDKERRAIERQRHNQRIIVGVIIFSLLFVLVLFFYAIVLTHKVAGPLFKISKYFEKMEVGNFEEPTPLRRGDQLQGFYDKFKAMHAALRKRMEDDLRLLEALEKECGESISDTALKAALHSRIEGLRKGLHMDLEERVPSADEPTKKVEPTDEAGAGGEPQEEGAGDGASRGTDEGDGEDGEK